MTFDGDDSMTHPRLDANGQTSEVSKRRLAVVLRLPDPCSTEIDGLRRALGDTQMRRIVPHITVIPPVNVRDEDLDEVCSVVRAAAASQPSALEVAIGPVTTFAPANPVLYLAVEPVESVRAVFEACLSGPLDRPQKREFVPHVTIDINRPDDEHPVAISLLSGYRAEVSISGLDLMQLQTVDDAEQWRPIADAVFGAEAQVDAGSMRVTLTESTLVDPIAAASLGVEPDAALGRGDGDGLVVTAREPGGRVVGVAAGRRRGRRASVFRSIWVDEGVRGQGVARRLVEAWERAAVAGGAVRAVAPGVTDAESNLLAHLGWGHTNPILDRRFA